MFLVLAAVRATPFGMLGLEPMAREFLVVETLESGVGGQGGFFRFPADEAAPPDRVSGLLLFHEDNRNHVKPRRHALELAKCLALGLVLAVVLSLIGGSGRRRFGASVLVGALASVTVLGSNWIWFDFPDLYILAQMAQVFLSYVVAGAASVLAMPPKVSLP